MVQNAVLQEFGKANVVSKLVPWLESPSASAESVRKEEVSLSSATARVSVTDDETTKLFNARVFVELSHQQVIDESLASALLAFRRAANVLGQVQDHVVFNGYATMATAAEKRRAAQLADPYAQFIASGPSEKIGLVGAKSFADKTNLRAEADAARAAKAANAQDTKKWADDAAEQCPTRPVRDAEGLVKEIVRAIGSLEKDNHPGPFVCVLGTNLFTLAHTPMPNSMVLPADRINPLLDRPLLRSGRLDFKVGNDEFNHGVIVSLGAGGPDIVVGTRPKAQFLQIKEDAKYVFRVYLRAVLRIKDPSNPGVRAFFRA
jgi:hypothetical protein